MATPSTKAAKFWFATSMIKSSSCRSSLNDSPKRIDTNGLLKRQYLRVLDRRLFASSLTKDLHFSVNLHIIRTRFIPGEIGQVLCNSISSALYQLNDGYSPPDSVIQANG